MARLDGADAVRGHLVAELDGHGGPLRRTLLRSRADDHTAVRSQPFGRKQQKESEKLEKEHRRTHQGHDRVALPLDPERDSVDEGSGRRARRLLRWGEDRFRINCGGNGENEALQRRAEPRRID